MQSHHEPILLRFGGAKKPTSTMNHKELEALSDNVVNRAREKAFSKGRPIIYSKSGKVYREWPDGLIELVK